MRFSSTAAFCVWAMAAPVLAQSNATVTEGRAAFLAGDYATSLEMLRPEAEAGDATAQNILGVLYNNGHGVEQDIETALGWYELAAQQGLDKALYNLGNFHSDAGSGAHFDYAKAIDYYDQAIAMGYHHAMLNRGVMHEYGRGGPVDDAAAAELYQSAADAGNAIAMSNLATLYRNGYGVEQNTARALELYQQGAALDNVDALANLGNWYYYGDNGVETDYAKAIEYLDQAAAMDHAGSIVLRGYMIDVGEGGEADLDLAIEYYERGADLGNTTAMTNLAFIYSDGDDDDDLGYAIDLYRQAADLGDYDAMSDLGFMYEYGHGTTKDRTAAFALYRFAAAEGAARGAVNYALMLADSESGWYKPSEAYGWCLIGVDRADSGDVAEFSETCEEISVEVGPSATTQGQAWANEQLGG